MIDLAALLPLPRGWLNANASTLGNNMSLKRPMSNAPRGEERSDSRRRRRGSKQISEIRNDGDGDGGGGSGCEH